VLRSKSSVADAVDALAEVLAAGLEASDFERGCPVATTALEVGARSDAIGAAARASFDSWVAPLRERLEAAGAPPRVATQRADLAIAALEGALVLARARRDAAVLRAVGSQLRPLMEP
jgi:TetR/AcrR family transcriptional repressor of lmrAB and yxaGH operons